MLKLDPVKQDLPAKKESLLEVGESLDIPALKNKSEELNKKTLADNFWNDSEAAQKVLQEKKSVDDKVKSYEELLKEQNGNISTCVCKYVRRHTYRTDYDMILKALIG